MYNIKCVQSIEELLSLIEEIQSEFSKIVVITDDSLFSLYMRLFTRLSELDRIVEIVQLE